ncbi:formin-like protein 5 [Musa acuminata AAA Group]|uniref:formin-like protein 5 n=1 Tax=Musa acuminata AAA Group TaxID=214697 RepID=UPI0031D0936F
MALFKRLFFRKPPDRLLEIAERVYVFDCCFSTETTGECEYKNYMGGAFAQLQGYHPDASFMVCNFRERDKRSQISDILSEYDIMVMDYPLQSKGCPLLPLVMIHHFLKSSESWLSMEGLHNVLLMHCEREGWLVLAFMLASLLLYGKQYTGEQKTLEMVYKQAPKEFLHLLSPLNPQPSHLRYLQYISRRGSMSDWPPRETTFTLECLIIKAIPRFDREGGCRPMVRIYRQDHLTPTSSSPKMLFATPRTKKHIHHYRQAVTTKINACCCVQGDIVIECLHLDEDLEHEEMMFRVMFNTAFVQSNILALTRDEIDLVWSAKDHFPKDFKIEVVFSNSDASISDTSTEMVVEGRKETQCVSKEAAEFFEAEAFSSSDWHDIKRDPYFQIHDAKRDPGRSPKDENYILSEGARCKLEMSNSDEVSKSMITQNFADVEKIGVNSEFPGMLGQAEIICETSNFKHDKEIVAERLVDLDIVVPIEDKMIVERSTPPQQRNGTSTSEAEEKIALENSDFNQERVGDIKVSAIPENMSHKLEAPSMAGMLKQESSIKRSAARYDEPSSETSCCGRHTGSLVIGDEVEPRDKNRLETLGIGFQTMSGLPTTSTKPKVNDEMSVLADYMVACEEKNIIEVSNYQHELKDIVVLAVEDDTTEMCDIKHDSAHIVTDKMINLHDIHCESEAQALKVKAESILEQRECKPNPEITVNRKKFILVDKAHNPGNQDIENKGKFKMEMHVGKDNTENGVSESEIDLKVVSQKALYDGQMLTPKESPCTISKKIPTCIRLSDSGVIKTRIKQQESVGYGLPPLSPAILSCSFAKGPSCPPMLLGESTKGLPLLDSHVISGASVKSAALPPPPPSPPLCPKANMKGALLPQPPSAPPHAKNLLPPPLLLPNRGGRTQGPPPSPPPPSPLDQNVGVYIPHPPHSAISVKCFSMMPPAPPLEPLLNSHSNASKPPEGAAPILSPPPSATHGGARPPLRAPGAHGGAPPPPPPPRARTPKQRASPHVRRLPSSTVSAMPVSQVDARGISPRHGLICPTSSVSSAPCRSSLKPLHWVKVTRAVQGSIWAELQKSEDASNASEFDVSELERLFPAVVPKNDISKTEGRHKFLGLKPDKVRLIDLRRANNTEIMLTKVKIPLSDLVSAALAMDDSILDVDQVENMIKFCPTKEEMELLKGYTGDKDQLGKCEQYFLELMKVPRVESKLRVFSFKIQFGSQVLDIRKSLNTIDSVCEQVCSSAKLKEIMKKILYLGNTLNQGTARGSAIGFHLDSLLKLTDTRSTNNKMTLMHYLCKALAIKSPHLLDFHEDITSLEAASKIQLKYLAEEMQAVVKGLEKVGFELQASENDGPISEVFLKTLKEFTAVAAAEVQSLTMLYTEVGRKADALALYFGEDPAQCSFEQVVTTLRNFISLFRRAHQDNCKQAELEKKAEKDWGIDKSKSSTPRSRAVKDTRETNRGDKNVR